MKTKHFMQIGAALASSLALMTMADAQPGKGKGGGKDKGGGPPAHAQGGGKGKADKPGKPDHAAKGPAKGANKSANAQNKADKHITKAIERTMKDVERGKPAKFKDRERDRVLAYFAGFRDERFGLPPGLAMNLQRGKPLPPGWQKKLAEGSVVDAELWDDFAPVPYEWIPEVERYPDSQLYWYGDRVFRVHEPTREIVDVIVVPTIDPAW